MSDTVLLTGLSGFIAKHVAMSLLNAGFAVRGTVRDRAKGQAARETLAAHGADVSRLETVVLDLTQDRGWGEAAMGCRFVQHTASPFPGAPPRDKFALVPAARDGTLRVVRAAQDAGVERLVLTSSVVAVYHGHDRRTDKRFTEADFSNVESPTISSYAVSKTLAEKAAWEAVGAGPMQLAVLNPAFVLGPALDRQIGTSLSVIAMMMRGLMPLVPDARFGVVDVRDVADAHLNAMIEPDAAGRRFILSAGHRSLLEIGRTLADAYPTRRLLPRGTIPTRLVEWASMVSTRAALLRNELDPDRVLDGDAAVRDLNLRYRTPEEAVGAAARSLHDVGIL